MRRFSVGSDGSLSGGEVIYQMEGFSLETGIPDGQKLDAAGNLWVSGPGGLHVVTGEGAAARPHPHARERRQPGLGRRGLEDALHLHLLHGAHAAHDGRGASHAHHELRSERWLISKQSTPRAPS